MNHHPDDSRYPYTSLPGREAEQFERSPWRPIAWRVGRWLACACGFLLVAVIGFVGVEAYRSVVRWSLVERLEQFPGCSVAYAHEYPFQVDALPERLRERLGEHVWTDVLAVSHVDFTRNRDSLSASDVQEICQACSHFPRLKSFQITSNHFECKCIETWPSLKVLEEVTIRCSQLDDADLAVISRMRRLKKLKLDSAKISEAGLRHLSTLEHLESLGLYSFQFLKSGVPGAKRFASLKHIDMESSPDIGDDAIAAFGELPQLEEIMLIRSRVSDKGMSRLLSGGKLSTLIVPDSLVSDEGLKSLKKSAQPLFLNVEGTKVTDSGLAVLAGMQLRGLVLDETAVTDDCFKAIGQVRSLDYLSLSNSQVTGVGAVSLASLGSMPQIQLDGSEVTTDGFSVLANLPCRVLSVANTKLSDKELMFFANSTTLEVLDVSGTVVTQTGVRAFYTARSNLVRLAGGQGRLLLQCDFPELVASIIGIDPNTGEAVSSP